MIRFCVYDDKGLAPDWPIAGAHLIGSDDVALRGLVEFADGQIIAHGPPDRAIGISVRFDTGPMGELMLSTCLLPPRDEPYHLSLELARHRFKTFISKSEEWQMFDLSPEHPAVEHWEEARSLFTRALTTSDPLEVDRMARASLAQAIDATERLALAHAEILLHRRFAERAASSTTLGVRVWPGQDSPALKELVNREFDVLMLPLRWREIEAQEGKFNWAPLDNWMLWAQKQGKPIVAGPLLDFSRYGLPEWMGVWQHDYGTCRDLAYDYVERVLARYGDVVGMWNIASGINVNSNFDFTEDQMLDMVRMARLAVRHRRKSAKCMVELTQPFGEHLAFKRQSVEPVTFIDRLTQEGVRFETVGIQLLQGGGRAGQFTRDLMQISSMLDRFFLLDTRVIVSALGVPSSGESEHGGHWHSGWSQQLQATWATRLFALIMSKPFVDSIIWNSLYDYRGSLLPAGGMFDDTGHAKEVFSKLVGVRRRLRKPLGPLKLPPKQRQSAQAASAPAGPEES